MSTEDDTAALVREVAEGLGFSTRNAPDVWHHEYGWVFDSESEWITQEVITFAAIAREEMRKRGFHVVIGDNVGIYAGSERAFILAEQIGSGAATDEAVAVISAIHHALAIKD